MKAATEELLYVLLWGAENLMRPSFHRLNESFETWSYRKGLLHQIAELERRKLLERKPSKSAERIYRLTPTGRLVALGGIDPPTRWNREWDGRWRIVAFDLPEKENAARVRLRRLLKDRGFGYLQNSFWITPDPLDTPIARLAAKGQDVESFVTLEAMPCSGESNQARVAGAWNFEGINERYEFLMSWLQRPPSVGRGQDASSEELQQWAREEKRRWQSAISVDPFLPAELLPKNYLGRKAWNLRGRVLGRAGGWLS